MTGNEIYEAALALMSEEPERITGLKQFAIPFINQIIAQTNRINRSVLISEGKKVNDEVQKITSLNDTVNMSEELVRECFPYGLAALFCANEDRESFNWLNYEFNTRLQKYNAAVLTDMGVGI